MNEKLAIALLSIIYLVGLVGIGFDIDPRLIFLTPLNLLISMIVISLYDTSGWKTFAVFAALIFSLGYGIEVLGVHTGKIFGEYSYGEVLGLKLWDTPLMIGINWLLLVYTAGNLVNWVAGKIASIWKIIAGSTLLLLLDLLIEPIAIQWGMWTWADIEIPTQNFIAWWLIAFVMMGLYYLLMNNKVNKVAAAVFIIQVIFFGILNLSKYF